MDCQTVRDHLSSYVDHDVPEGMRMALDQHLESCPKCCREFTQLHMITAWVRDFPLVEPSPMFLQQVRDQVGRLPRRSKPAFFRRLTGALPLQVAAAIAVVSAALVWQITPDVRQSQIQEVPAPAYREPWLSRERSVAPILDAPLLEPAIEEPLPTPAPLVQVLPRWAGAVVQEDVVRVGRESAGMPRLAGITAGGWSSEASYLPSLTLRAADPVQAAQQIWELVPRLGGELLQAQGMVTPADRTSPGVVRLTLAITADRYPMFLEAIRQLSGATVSEERMAMIGREVPQAAPGFLRRVDHTQVAKPPPMTLVLSILRR
jgi:Putative zinc-finger